MTEFEKMLDGALYNSSDVELVKLRDRAKMLCYKYNNLSPDLKNEKINYLEELFDQKLDNPIVESPFHCDYGFNIKVGKNFYANYNLVILDVNKVVFGDNVFIGPNCGFYTAGHPVDLKTRNSGLEFGYPITVGNNVWIGGNVSVLPNVKIGNNVVIGAGSVVTHDIEDNSIAYGNPCKVVKKI